MSEEKKECDYCSTQTKKEDLRGTPYIADIGKTKNGMCRTCWNMINSDEIGDFDED